MNEPVNLKSLEGAQFFPDNELKANNEIRFARAV